jgi:TRAP transporter 4TM/12TM fusion protein
MELCRRCVGVPILCVAGVLLVYTFASGTTLKRLIYTLFYTTSGIMSTPVQVCAKYIVVFIIFGAFLERTGIAAFFIDVANSLVGGFAGGPAKVAVISSALCGMVSGSSVGNTVTTGSVTIPMMKKTGYKPEFAGAVEAAASTGGQIMPPIMGAAAFLMAEYMNVTYAEVALRAILPAVLYFTGIFISVHLEAKKLGLRGMNRSELPRLGRLMGKIYLLLPLVVLVWLVTTNTRTMQFSATIAIIIAIIVSLFDKDNRITIGKILEALEAGGKSTITVAVACSMAGIISGCITATGLASKLISTVVSVSNAVQILDPTFVALFLTMICCIILGMGVPTTANYCIMASTCAPILITIGVPKIAAHFFVFYFGIVADITPPVALAAYAGSAIAKANPMKTGINATKLAIAAFIVPYIFCMNPAMLLIDVTFGSMVQIIITSLVGLFGVAAALEGYLLKELNPIFRIAIGIGGILMMIPGTFTDVIGVVLFVIVAGIQVIQKRTQAAAA